MNPEPADGAAAGPSNAVQLSADDEEQLRIMPEENRGLARQILLLNARDRQQREAHTQQLEEKLARMASELEKLQSVANTAKETADLALVPAAGSSSSSASAVEKAMAAVRVFSDQSDEPRNYMKHLEEQANLYRVSADRLAYGAVVQSKLTPAAEAAVRAQASVDGVLQEALVTKLLLETILTSGGYGKYGTAVKRVLGLAKVYFGLVMRDRIPVEVALDRFQQHLLGLPSHLTAGIAAQPAGASDVEGPGSLLDVLLISLCLMGFPPQVHDLLRADKELKEFSTWQRFLRNAADQRQRINDELSKLFKSADETKAKRPTAAPISSSAAGPAAAGYKRPAPALASPQRPFQQSRPASNLPARNGVPVNVGPVPTRESHPPTEWRWFVDGLDKARRDELKARRACFLCGSTECRGMTECRQRAEAWRTGKLRVVRKEQSN